MKKIATLIKYEFSETIRRPKILLVLFFLIVLFESDISPIKNVYGETGLRLGVLEPFVLMCTRSVNIILIPLIFIILINDFPNCKTDYFRMIRLGKREWLIGEIAFIFLFSFAMIAVLLIGTIIPVTDISDFSNEWSGFMTSLNESFPEIYIHNLRITLDASVVIQSLPVSAAVYSFLIMWLNLVIYGLLLLLGTITSRRMTALTATLATVFIGGAATFFSGGAKWIFPIAHSQIGLHYNSIFSKVNFPVFMSYVYLAAAAIAIVIICGRLIKNMTFVGELS